MVSAFSGVHCNQSPVLDAIKTLRQLGAPTRPLSNTP
jgi:hypothetical protein